MGSALNHQGIDHSGHSVFIHREMGFGMHTNKDNSPEEQADHGQVGSTCSESFQPAISRVDASKVDYQQLMTKFRR